MLIAALLAAVALTPVEPAIFPRAQEVRHSREAPFLLNQNTVVVDPAGQFNILHDLLKRAAGVTLTRKDAAPQLNYIRLGRTRTLPPGGYTMSVTQTAIEIAYPDDAGAFHAVQTLRQLLPPQIESTRRTSANWEIPAVEIKDWPRFPWRGMHLDVSRHFFKATYIKKFIDYLAMHKMNTFHWHLVDDGGWRQESKRFPKLTAVGAWRTDTGEIWPGGAWNMGNLEFPGKESGKKLYGGFYTQKEIRDIVKYAKKRHVTVVPEIEMPGHALPALVAYPELGCQNIAAAGLPRTNVFCVGNDKTLTFLEDILDETIGLFPSKFIHIGADEVWKGLWKNCPRCQARINAEGLKDEDELQSWFVKRMERHLAKRGRRLIGWDEILEGGLAPGAAVMSWRGIDGGIAAAKAGHDVVMSPTSHCYFDYSYATTSTEKAYSYEPVPSQLNAEQAKHILGAQANVWTEFIATEQRVDEMIFPRMLGIAEGVWTMPKRRNFADFKRRLDAYYKRLDIMGTAYYLEAPRVGESAIFFDESAEVAVDNAKSVPFVLRYTLDGFVPTTKSLEYTGPIGVTNDCDVTFAYVTSAGRSGDPVRVQCRKVKPRQGSAGLVPGIGVKAYEGTWTKLPNFSELREKTWGRTPSIDLANARVAKTMLFTSPGGSRRAKMACMNSISGAMTGRGFGLAARRSWSKTDHKLTRRRAVRFG